MIPRLEVLWLVAFLVALAWDTSHSQGQPPAPCSDPRAREFDFWIGEWDLTWGEDGTGTNIVTREYGGCVIRENFSAPGMGFQGMSVSVFDPNAGVWRQTWVDDAGGYLDFVGKYEEGVMRLSRSGERGGTRVLQRMTFHDITHDAFVWYWEISKDDGANWEMRWQIHYARRG